MAGTAHAAALGGVACAGQCCRWLQACLAATGRGCGASDLPAAAPTASGGRRRRLQGAADEGSTLTAAPVPPWQPGHSSPACCPSSNALRTAAQAGHGGTAEALPLMLGLRRPAAAAELGEPIGSSWFGGPGPGAAGLRQPRWPTGLHTARSLSVAARQPQDAESTVSGGGPHAGRGGAGAAGIDAHSGAPPGLEHVVAVQPTQPRRSPVAAGAAGGSVGAFQWHESMTGGRQTGQGDTPTREPHQDRPGVSMEARGPSEPGGQGPGDGRRQRRGAQQRPARPGQPGAGGEGGRARSGADRFSPTALQRRISRCESLGDVRRLLAEVEAEEASHVSASPSQGGGVASGDAGGSGSSGPGSVPLCRLDDVHVATLVRLGRAWACRGEGGTRREQGKGAGPGASGYRCCLGVCSLQQAQPLMPLF